LSPEQLQDAAKCPLTSSNGRLSILLLDYAKAASIIPHDMSLARFRQQFRVFNTNVRAAQSYRPAHLSGRIALFRAAERLPARSNSRLGVDGKLEVYDDTG
jgi:hypothetical protein